MSDLPSAGEKDVLRRRAQELARPMAGDETALDLDLLIFETAGEHFAIEVGSVDAVAPLAGLTRIPRLPAWIRGILNHRGGLCCAIDLSLLAGNQQAGIVDFTHLVFTSSGGRSIGLLAASIGIVQRRRSDFSSSASSAPYIHGVDSGLICLLDPARLLSDPRLVVRQGARGG